MMTAENYDDFMKDWIAIYIKYEMFAIGTMHYSTFNCSKNKKPHKYILCVGRL